MSGQIIPVFKDWVPDWLIKIVLFVVLLPTLVLFFLPLSNINVAAGHYGAEPYDIQFSVALFYAGYTSFFSLERRFFDYMATKEYFFVITFIQILSSYICFHTQSLAILFPLRFLQGMALTATASLSLSLIFNRLRSQRAREVGFSVYFGMLICMIPFNNFITADIIDAFNFDTLYKCAIFSYAPSLILLGLIMNNVRLNIKFPLYKLDWASFVIYAVILCLTAYILIYGQEYYWFTDSRILTSAIFIAVFLIVFWVRQRSLKRPYFNLAVFKHRNFIIGGFILFVLYICRFASGITSGYFNSVLGLDPINVSYLNLFNIAGLVVGVIASCVAVLRQKPIRLIWLLGFSLILAYQIWMIFLFNTQANQDQFIIPLLLQGLGIGTLMTPTIIFMISAAPSKLSVTAAGICLFVRCFGFYASIAFINFYELYSKSKHFNTFQDLTGLNQPIALQRIANRTHYFVSKGIYKSEAIKMSHKSLVAAINKQTQIRFAMDYFELLAIMVFFTLLLIAVFPYLSKTVLYIKSKQVPI